VIFFLGENWPLGDKKKGGCKGQRSKLQTIENSKPQPPPALCCLFLFSLQWIFQFASPPKKNKNYSQIKKDIQNG